ncbi:MAG: dephospho-CoA kinase, partial [Candidatus Woesearchaeota archaeon]|nr:dephospho-CoA kinase [Candidatus Woesearchaeota archaeon]
TDELLKKQGLAVTEENEKRFRENVRKEHGMEAYAKLNLEKIKAAMERGNVAIDGLYSWEEYLFLKDEFPKMVVLCVYAPPEERYDRLVDREIRGLTREQAMSRDRSEVENLNKGGPIAMADYTLLNIYNLHDLDEHVDRFFEWMDESNF